eukprot:EG_transcript_7740
MACLMLIQFCEGLTFYLLMPLLPFIVQHLKPGIPLGEVGYYAGYLSSAPALGAMVGCPLWGAVSDTVGRRPVLLMGLLLPSLCLLGLALAPSFAWALAFRGLQGFFNVNTTIAKTYVTELCTSKTVMRGIGMLVVPFSLSQMVGPLVAGLLARPANADGAEAALLARAPHLMCVLVPVAFSGGAFLLGLCCLPESLPALASATPVVEGSKPLLAEKGSRLAEVQRALRTREGAMAVLLFALAGGVHWGFLTLFPLWVVLPAAQGGFDFSSRQLGSIMACVGPVQMLWMPLVAPMVVQWLGLRRSWTLECLLWAVVLFCTPFARQAPAYPTAALVALFLAGKLLFVMVHCGSAVLLSHAVPGAVRGTFVGVAHTAGSLCRFVIPPACSALLAWLQQQAAVPGRGGWPLDYHLPFHLLGLGALAVGIWSLWLPPAVEQKAELRAPPAESLPTMGGEGTRGTV